MSRFRMISAAVLSVAIAAPLAGFAKEGNPGKARVKGIDNTVRIQKSAARTDEHTIIVANCPPGLAKKNPSCVPPGQAKKGLVVGDIFDLKDIHIVTRPGLYGLGEPPAGNRYAIVDGRLVRVDSGTGRLLSIIRLVDAILD